ncbi:MAG: deacetylase [Clostridiales bacterium]|nr:deacetylase [Clostridiales bacterium]
MYFATIDKKKFFRVCCLLLVGVLCCITLRNGGGYQVFYGGTMRRLPIYSVHTDEKRIAISFDCAWGVDYTDRLLEIMENNDVVCTFFMVEFWVKKYPEYVLKIDKAGHEIGTHSSTHPYMSKLSKTVVEKELVSSINAIKDVTNKEVTLFRPPYGDYDNQLIEVAESLNLYTIQWSVDSLDWKNLSAYEIQTRVLSRTGNGDIVLFHNNGLHTADALQTIISRLKSDGYEFVKIGDLIYKENYKIDVNGRQIKNV